MNIKHKISIATFFAVIIPVLIISISTYYIFSGKIKKLEEDKIKIVNDTIESELLNTVNDSNEILNYLINIYTNRDDFLISEDKELTNKNREQHMLHHIRSLSTVEKSVKILGYGNANKGMFFDVCNCIHKQELEEDFDPTQKEWYIGAINSDDYYLSNFFMRDLTGEVAMSISKKIVVDGEIVGVVVIVLDLDHVSEDILKYKIGNNGHYFIVDTNHTLMFGSEISVDDYQYISDIDLFHVDGVSGATERQLKKDEYSSITKKTPKGDMYFHLNRIGNLNFALIGSAYYDDLYSPVYFLRNFCILIVILALILVSIYLFLFSRSFDNSLNRLTYIIKKITSGNYSKNIDELTEIIDEKSELGFIKDAIKDMRHEIEKREVKLKYISETDPLTKISNRRAIMSLIDNSLEGSENIKIENVLIMFDLDKFKRLNDNFGHLFGDEVLRKICKTISENIKDEDEFGRYGGEEFLILLRKTSLENGVIVANRLRKIVEILEWEEDVVVTISMGIVQNKIGEDLNSLLARVDALLYNAKDNGRNRVEY